MARRTRLINGKGNWEAEPPTGASDADLYQLANDFIPQGGVVDLAGGDAEVTEADTPARSVKVAAGTIYVPNSSWVQNSDEPRYYQIIGDADEVLSLSTNSSGSTRIDKIAQKIDKVTAPNDEATNVSPLVVIEGTPGAGVPATPADHEALASVSLADGYATVTNAMITDLRRQVYLDSKQSLVQGGFTTLADGATITLDLATGIRKFRVTLGGNRDIVFANPKQGDAFYLRITNDGTARTPDWPGTITWIGIEDDPDMADYVEAGKVGAFMFICTNAITPAYDAFFLGAEE